MKRSLLIGINDYPGTGNDLSGCVNDANDWIGAMEVRGFDGTSLLDGEASKSNMVEAISKIVGDTGRDDIAVILRELSENDINTILTLKAQDFQKQYGKEIRQLFQDLKIPDFVFVNVP